MWRLTPPWHFCYHCWIPVLRLWIYDWFILNCVNFPSSVRDISFSDFHFLINYLKFDSPNCIWIIGWYIYTKMNNITITINIFRDPTWWRCHQIRKRVWSIMIDPVLSGWWEGAMGTTDRVWLVCEGKGRHRGVIVYCL